jgi:hypothetical protein
MKRGREAYLFAADADITDVVEHASEHVTWGLTVLICEESSPRPSMI